MKRRELGPVPSLATGSPGAWVVAAADARRFLHDHEATALQMPHDPIGRYAAVNVSESCTRFLPLKQTANAMLSARSPDSAGLSLSSGMAGR